MPGRSTPLVNDQIYHVFNRGIDHRPTFTDKKEFERAMITLSYYQFSNPMKLSKLLQLPSENREKVLSELESKNDQLIEIVCFCLMPNHFHFLIKQLKENGIAKFLSNFQNSYTRYFNTRNKRTGPLFLDQFKAVLVETDEQLVHVSRYIHLNPLTSFVVKNFEDLKDYPWSSFGEYLFKNYNMVCSKESVLNFFRKNDYEAFAQDQVKYQQELHRIKHLILE